tara:strand:+ start:1055 stop:1372 length:318 start_codon:yes stop_codon:yes gene_type:complete
MPKKEHKLSDQDIKDILYTIERQYKRRTIDEKKAILKKIGISKDDIEKLNDKGLVDKLISEFNKILPTIDLNNFTIEEKYKTVNEYISGDRKSELKTETENYKKL